MEKTKIGADKTSKFNDGITLLKYSQEISSGVKESWQCIADRVSAAVTLPFMPKLYNPMRKWLRSKKVIPGGRYLYAAGKPFHAINNCFLMDVDDSRLDWSSLMYRITAALMVGGGVGVVYSKLREEGKLVAGMGGQSTGPIALMNMVNEAGRYIRQGGSRRCLPADAPVHTRYGVKRIEDVSIGDEVMTADGYRSVTNKFEQGIQKLVEIKTQNGSLKCTSNHKVAVITKIDGNGKVFYQWKKAEDLVEDDRLYFVNEAIEGSKQEFPNNDFERPSMSFTHNSILIPELDTDSAWLIGYIHGNGYVHLKDDNESGTKRHGRVVVTCPDSRQDIIDKLEQELSRWGVGVRRKAGDGAVTNVVAHSVELGWYMQKYIKKPKASIEIPEFIMNSTIDVRSAYVAGLMDADGCCDTRPVNIVTSIYPSFLEQVQIILSSLGIATRLKMRRKARNNWKELWQLNVVGNKNTELFFEAIEEYGHKLDYTPRVASQFSYSVPIKDAKELSKNYNTAANISIEKIEKTINKRTRYTPVRVICVEEAGEDETYDIEVNDRHEYVTNGYVVHNSALWAGLHWNHPDIMKFIHMKNWSEDIRALKVKDFNFPAPMDGTNISTILDTLFYTAYNNKSHKLHDLAQSVYWATIEQMCTTAEPGLSVDMFGNDGEHLRNACCEVTSRDDSDVCNLVSMNLARFDNIDDFRKAVFDTIGFMLCGTMYSKVPYGKVEETRDKNRRLGLGLMGVHEWLLVRGKKYGPDEEFAKWLEVWRDTSDEAADYWAGKLKINVPVKKRAIAPTGSIAIVGETTGGCEPVFAVAYKRRYLRGHKWVYQYVVDRAAQRIIDKGVNPLDIEDAYEIAENVERRVEFQAFLQDYTDNAISSTINMPRWGSEHNNEGTIKSFGNMLMKYIPRIRGVTVYPDGARDGQILTKVPYNEAIDKVGVEFEEVTNEHICADGVCGS